MLLIPDDEITGHRKSRHKTKLRIMNKRSKTEVSWHWPEVSRLSPNKGNSRVFIDFLGGLSGNFPLVISVVSKASWREA